MAVTGFLGPRSTADWTTNQRPKNFREGLALLFPNGDVPLTAMNSMGKSSRVDDPKYTWFRKKLPVNGGDMTEGAFTDSALTSTHGGGSATAGETVYAKVTLAISKYFRVGHTVMLIDSSNLAARAFGRVTARNENGDNSFVAVQLLKDNGASILDVVDYVDIVGNANAEGAFIPTAISFDPTEFYNYTQIFRNSLNLTRTAKLTKLRTGPAMQEAKRESFLLHGLDLENAAFWGERTLTTGENGKPLRTTQGGISFVTENYSAHIVDFPTDSNLNWAAGGRDYLNEKLELFFRFGSRTKVAYCGSGALLGIQQLVDQFGSFEITSETIMFGTKVANWMTPFGTLKLIVHPLLTHKSYTRNAMFIHEPEHLALRWITDTHFKKDTGEKEGGVTGYDGTKEEWLTEAGWEWSHPETMAFMTGIGLNG